MTLKSSFDIFWHTTRQVIYNLVYIDTSCLRRDLDDLIKRAQNTKYSTTRLLVSLQTLQQLQITSTVAISDDDVPDQHFAVASACSRHRHPLRRSLQQRQRRRPSNSR